MNSDILHLGLVDDDEIALDAAALDLAALDHPGFDPSGSVAILEGMADRLLELGPGADDDETRAALLAAVIGTEYGFVGDRGQYDDPANGDMIHVIARRRGLPVSLAILHVAAARRLGWTADALDTPGHVLVRIGGPDGVVTDPFAGGRIVGQAAIDALVLAAGAVRARVAAMTNRSVLVRLLLNQATRAERSGDGGRARILFERMTVVAPGNGHGWWERARLELAAGDVGAARQSLGAMLETTRDPVRRGQIGHALAALPPG